MDLTQVLVAASTFIITKLGQSVITNGNIVFWLLLFIASLTLVFIPRLGVNVFLSKAKYQTFHAYVKFYEESFSNQPLFFDNQSFTKKRQPYFINQLWLETNESYNFFLDFITTLLNVFLNIAVLSIVINSYLILGYFLSSLLICIGLVMTRKKIKHVNIESQNSQADLNESLISGWDTILIGNKYNKNMWDTYFSNKCTFAMLKNVRLAFFSGITSLITTAVSLIPILGVILWILLQNLNDKSMLTALVVTLPRQVNIVQYIGILIDFAVQATGVVSKIKNIEKNANLPEKTDRWIGQINWEKIEIFNENNRMEISSIEEFKQAISVLKACRITVRGENGSGKSTLLKWIKHIWGDQAFYFPPLSKLFFIDKAGQEYSTGGKIVYQIQDIVKNANASIILLDEWDANLDATNIYKISALIDEIARSKCVVEVRHRK